MTCEQVQHDGDKTRHHAAADGAAHRLANPSHRRMLTQQVYLRLKVLILLIIEVFKSKVLLQPNF